MHRLFVHLDELLQLNIALEPLTELLAIMFAGAPPTDSNGSLLKQVEEIHMQVNEKHIEMIFQLLVRNDKERAKIVHALQYMAKVGVLLQGMHVLLSCTCTMI